MQLITARRLIDGTGAPPLDWPAVLVDDSGRLAYVGPRTGLPPLAGAVPPLDLSDRTLLPGIIDVHVHLALDGGPDPVQAIQATDDATLLADMTERAARMLRAGITTARDCGARGGLDVCLRDQLAQGEGVGPRLIVSGSPLTLTDGHCHYLGGGAAPTTAEVQDQAHRQLARGADWVKMMVSGGRITPGSDATRPQFGPELVRAAAQVAHAAGHRLAAHAHATECISAAVAAGADSIEHCTWVSPTDHIDYAPAVAQEMAERGTFACLTAVPEREGFFAARYGAQWVEQRLEAVQRMQAAGVVLVFGTDSGIPNMPHDQWAEKLVRWRAAELDPLAIIHAATGRVAGCLGLADDLGTVVVGKRADLIAVDGNPVQDLDCLKRVAWVMHGGRVVETSSASVAPDAGAETY